MTTPDARRAAVAAILLALCAAAPADADPPARRGREEEGAKGGIPREMAARIDAAIDRGAGWLREELERELAASRTTPPEGDGPLVHSIQVWSPARCSLYAYALLTGGVPPSDPLIRQAWEAARTRPMRRTYEVALALMLREAMEHPPARPGRARPRPPRRPPRAGGDPDGDWTRQAANWLASGCDAGTWTYGCPGGTDGYPTGNLEGEDYEISGTRDAPSWGDDLASLLNRRREPATDLSNSQYAILGLKAASLLGVKPQNHRTMWRVVVARFLQMQESTGPEVPLAIDVEDASLPTYTVEGPGAPLGPDRARGWGYRANGLSRSDTPYASMTACGLAAMLIAQSEIDNLGEEERVRIAQSIRDGLAWFQANWAIDAPQHPEPAHLGHEARFYYLYGLERAGVLANFRTLGGHNWYREGADLLLERQSEDGRWVGLPNHRAETDGTRTAFALLFLARGTSTDYVVGGAGD